MFRNVNLTAADLRRCIGQYGILFWRAKPFGVRQLAAAFENDPICPFFKGSHESGSKLPHSEGALWRKNYAEFITTMPTLKSPLLLL
jgi:hypothetical protein